MATAAAVAATHALVTAFGNPAHLTTVLTVIGDILPDDTEKRSVVRIALSGWYVIYACVTLRDIA